MEKITLLISFVFFIIFLAGLLKPSWVIRSGKAGRGKVFLYYLLPSVVLFLVTGFLQREKTEEAWQNPEGVTELRLYDRSFTEMPKRLKEFKDLEDLSLENNYISRLNKDVIQNLPMLSRLSLRNNPLKELPEWLATINLDELDIRGTAIDSIPRDIRAAIPTIRFEDTPYEKKNLARLQKELEEQQAREAQTGTEEERNESLSEFALRKIIGKEYGYKKTFKKGHLYYTAEVAEQKVDSLGAFMVNNGYFNDDRTIAMQITYNNSQDVQAYELRAVYAGTDQPDEELQMTFKLLAAFVSSRVFSNKPVHFILTDNRFEEILYTFRSDLQ